MESRHLHSGLELLAADDRGFRLDDDRPQLQQLDVLRSEEKPRQRDPPADVGESRVVEGRFARGNRPSIDRHEKLAAKMRRELAQSYIEAAGVAAVLVDDVAREASVQL